MTEELVVTVNLFSDLVTIDNDMCNGSFPESSRSETCGMRCETRVVWACSSPGWRQMCHFNVTCVFKLPSYFLAAPSRPTLPPALGLLKASRFSSVLAVNRR